MRGREILVREGVKMEDPPVGRVRGKLMCSMTME